MRKCVVVVCVVMLMAALAHASLFDPAVINENFADPELAAGVTSNDINDWFDAIGYTYTQDDGKDGYPDNPYGENWAELGNGRWLYQQIGTYEENVDLDVTVVLGQRDAVTNPLVSVTVELFAGGDDSLAADFNAKRDAAEFPLTAVVGATLIGTSGPISPFPTPGVPGTFEGTYSFSTGTVSEGYAVGDPLWIVLSAPSVKNRALIGNVIVELPTSAVLIGPDNGKDRADINADLVWSTPPIGTVDHYILNIRQGDPNFADAGTTVVDPATSAHDMGTMPYATTYYWRVDVVNDSAETIIGKTWSFTTAPEVPQIDEQPAGVLVPADGSADATFTLAGLNIVNYKWQKDGSPLSDVGNISGSSTATLTVTGAALEDEGLYSCVVDNDKGDEDETAKAVLMTERLVAHFAFDNDLTDTQGNLDTGVVIDPNEGDANVPDVGYDTGIVGSGALSLGANKGVEGYQAAFVEVPGSEDAFRSYHLGLTVSAWMKSAGTDLDTYYYPAFVRVQYDDTDGVDPDYSNSAFNLRRYYGRGQVAVGGITARALVPSETEPDIRDTEWHWVTGVYERSYDLEAEAWTGSTRIYIDGKLRTIISGLAREVDLDNLGVLRFGATRINLDGSGITQHPFVGLIDDVKIYSYPLDSYTIANEYVDVLPEKSICVEQAGLELFDITGPDGVPDCAVDMYDFAELASVWLNCNRVAGTASGLVNCN